VTPRLLVLGGGRIGAALMGGLVRSGWARPEECVVVEKDADARERLGKRFPELRIVEKPIDAEAAVLAVKPSDLTEACVVVQQAQFDRVLSVVAGATLAHLELHLWPGAPVVRAMPNTPALLGMSASAIAGGTYATEVELEWAEGVLSSIGVVARLPESLIDAATGLSGSGPAYVFLVAEALIDAGVLAGLDREVSRLLSVQTILGAAHMLAESGESAESLRAMVTSPGGTTAAGIRALEAAGLRAAVFEAVMAAKERSAELGRELT
jgi:pyrroline-5-carboxylate reductase